MHFMKSISIYHRGNRLLVNSQVSRANQDLVVSLVIKALRDQPALRVIEDPQGLQVHQETEGNQDLRAA